MILKSDEYDDENIVQMQYLKEQIQQGNVELAKLNGEQKAVPMDYSELQQKTNTQNKRGQILKKLQTLSSDEKQEWVQHKKLRANELYKAGKVEEAIQVYLDSLLGLNIKEENKLILKRTNLEFKYPIMLNIATCFYRQKEYIKAAQLCDKIIEEEDGKKLIKAYYKKAFSLVANASYQQAQKAVVEGLKVIKGTNNADESSIKKQDFLKLLAEIKQKSANYKQVYKRMFKDDEDQENQQQLLIKGSSNEVLREKEDEQVLVYRDSIWSKISSCLQKTYGWTVAVLGKRGKQKSI